MKRYGIGSTRSGFLLLEVIISLIIISVAITSVLRCFSVAMRGTRNAEIATTASLLANQLMQEFEILLPENDQAEGDFSEDGFPNYYWQASVEEIVLDYPDMTLEANIDDFKTLYELTIDVFYDDQRRRTYRACHLVTYVTGLEKFTHVSKQENRLY